MSGILRQTLLAPEVVEVILIGGQDVQSEAAYRPVLKQVTATIDGFQSPHGTELLATAD